MWYVLRKDFSPQVSSSIKFDRVRTVYIDVEGYMSCSCGYVQRMLMPCRHICSVLDKVENYVPSLFHIRWYKLFNYYYTKHDNESICPNTKDTLASMLYTTSENCYHMPGKYKGIFIKNTPFMKTLRKCISLQDEVNVSMDYILLETREGGAVVSNSYDLNKSNSKDSNTAICHKDSLPYTMQYFGGDSTMVSTFFSRTCRVHWRRSS